jgi:hypothetical protein
MLFARTSEPFKSKATLSIFACWVLVMPLGAVGGAACTVFAAILSFGCFKAFRFLHQIKSYQEGTKTINVAVPAAFLATKGGLLGFGSSAVSAKPLVFFRINDEVMGGQSTSTLAVEGQTLVFSGTINTNGGGFCSCRTLGDDEPLGLPAGTEALLVEATGDGQRHKLTLHTADSWSMSVPTWSCDFQPGASRTVHRLALSEFVPTKQGRVMAGLPPLDPTAVTGLGFSLSLYTAGGEPNPQFGPGPFRLAVHSVRVET